MTEPKAPEWILEDLDTPEAGTLVDMAIQKTRTSVTAKEVVELCVGNLFTVFLALLAPFMKGVAETIAESKSTK